MYTSRAPRPSKATAYHHIRLRLKRRNRREQTYQYKSRSPLISQEEYYKEYLKSKPSSCKPPTMDKKKRRRNRKTNRSRRDYNRCKVAAIQLLNDLREVRACACSVRSAPLGAQADRMELSKCMNRAKESIKSEVTTGFGGNTILKRMYLEFPLKVHGRRCMRCQGITSGLLLRVWKYSADGSREADPYIARNIESQVDDEFADEGLEYDWDTASLHKMHGSLFDNYI